jgi:hypothetical protein
MTELLLSVSVELSLLMHQGKLVEAEDVQEF